MPKTGGDSVINITSGSELGDATRVNVKFTSVAQAQEQVDNLLAVGAVVTRYKSVYSATPEGKAKAREMHAKQTVLKNAFTAWKKAGGPASGTNLQTYLPEGFDLAEFAG